MKLTDAGIYDIVNLFKGKSTVEGRTTGGSVLSGKSRVINIPAYQRPYRWDRERIEGLFNDYYDDNNGEYFVGSAVAVLPDKNAECIKFDIVDGQQRITTLYLLNYLRFLLMRERVHESIDAKYAMELEINFKEMKECYVDMIGKNNTDCFDRLNSTIVQYRREENWTKKLEKIEESFMENMSYAPKQLTEPDTVSEHGKRMKAFFQNEELCLQYTRSRYTELLKFSLCAVCLLTSSSSTELRLVHDNKAESDPNWHFAETYIVALDCMFDRVMKQAIKANPELRDTMDALNAAIDVITDLIKNLSFCLVVTEEENDAYKLFEVLNDRSMKMEDLELIKNHFYREYCNKSGCEDSQEIDNNIALLDERWNRDIFDEDMRSSDSRLVSFFAAVYLTRDKDLDNKNNAKYKNKIANKYSKQYTKHEKPYTYEVINRDFNIYFAIKILLCKIKLAYQRPGQHACEVEVSNEYSITYKTFHLLNAMNLPGVMSSLVNLIIATYWNLPGEFSENSFEQFVEALMKDKLHTDDRFIRIHKFAYYLWSAVIRSENYKIPREIAIEIIGRFGVDKYDDNSVVSREQDAELNQSLIKWINDYRYSKSDDLKLKILFLRLLRWCRYQPQAKSYKAPNDMLERGALSYIKDGKKVQLDHLEPVSTNNQLTQYFMLESPDRRDKIINGYIGNFMALDADKNLEKKNTPMEASIDEYYSELKSSWLVQDILSMMKDDAYFDTTKKIPKEEFFVERTKRLTAYFKAILTDGSDLNNNRIIVTFS